MDKIKITENELINLLKKNAHLTLNDVGKELNITRERVRQLYEQYKIERTFVPASDQLQGKAKMLSREAAKIGLAEACRNMGISYWIGLMTLKKAGLKYIPPSKTLLKEGLRKCYGCKVVLPVSEFHKQCSLCKKCNCTQSREAYRKKHPKIQRQHEHLYEQKDYVAKFYKKQL